MLKYDYQLNAIRTTQGFGGLPQMKNEYLYPKLRGRIIEKFRSYDAFAKAIGLDSTVLSRKLNGVMGITTKDIVRWSKPLDISLEEIGVFYFEQEFTAD